MPEQLDQQADQKVTVLTEQVTMSDQQGATPNQPAPTTNGTSLWDRFRQRVIWLVAPSKSKDFIDKQVSA